MPKLAPVVFLCCGIFCGFVALWDLSSYVDAEAAIQEAGRISLLNSIAEQNERQEDMDLWLRRAILAGIGSVVCIIVAWRAEMTPERPTEM